MPAVSTVLYPMPMVPFNAATLNGSYQAIGNPIPNDTRIIKIVNASDSTVAISINGTTAHDVAPAGGFFLYDIGTNRGNPAPLMSLPKGTQFYVNGSVGTGSIYLVAWYGLTSTATTTYIPS